MSSTRIGLDIRPSLERLGHASPWSKATAALGAVAVAAMLARLDVGGVVVAVLAFAALLWVTRRGAAREVRTVALLAYAARLLAIEVIQIGSEAQGRGGFVVGDDAAYFGVARSLAGMWHGAPYPQYGPESYLFSTFTYFESAVFYVVGPDVTIVVVLNAALAVGAVIGSYVLARPLFGRRAATVAAVLIAFYPSIFVWTSLNLKDALVLFVAAAVFVLGARFRHRAEWWLPLAGLALLAAIATVREYVYVELAAILVLATALGRGHRWTSRAAWGAASALGVLVLFALLPPTRIVGAVSGDLATRLESYRYGSGLNARTGFQNEFAAVEGRTYRVELPRSEAAASASPEVVHVLPGARVVVIASPGPTPVPTVASGVAYVRPGDVVVVGVAGTSPAPDAERAPVPTTGTTVPSAADEGHTYVVPTASPEMTPAATSAAPTPAPTVVHVQPGTRLVVVSPSPPGVVYVKPGDLVVVGSASVTAAPGPQQQHLPLPVTDTAVTLVEGGSHEAVPRTLAYLPRGVAYALFAPFPWAVGRTADLLTVPEMLLWYAIVALAIVSAWRSRARWADLLPLVVYAVMTTVVLALAEGNVGTLFRHRAMLIPPVIVIAAPLLLWVFDAAAARVRRVARR